MHTNMYVFNNTKQCKGGGGEDMTGMEGESLLGGWRKGKRVSGLVAL